MHTCKRKIIECICKLPRRTIEREMLVRDGEQRPEDKQRWWRALGCRAQAGEWSLVGRGFLLHGREEVKERVGAVTGRVPYI